MTAAVQTRLSAEEISRARTRWDVVAGDIPLKRVGRELEGLCPFHSEKTPSFRVVPEKGFYYCFGCTAHGDAIDYVMRTRGVDFATAVHELNGTVQVRPQAAAPQRPRQAPLDDGGGHQVYVDRILRECTPVYPDTPAHLYLWSRGLATKAPHTAKWRSNLLAHPALYCAEVDDRLPALVAPIEGTHGVTALQRIWVQTQIVYDGVSAPQDSRAPLKVRKKTIGSQLDGAVRLRPARRVLGLAEGVETAIAAGLRHSIPVWATCGASRLGSIALPECVEEVLIFGDNGPTGENLTYRAVELYQRRGLKAQACFPLSPYDDFNDLWIVETREKQ